MLHEKDCESKTIIPRITCLSLSIKLFKIRVLQQSRVAMLKKKEDKVGLHTSFSQNAVDL